MEVPNYIYVKLVGKDVAKLKKGKKVVYINPVAYERAEYMQKQFKYNPLIQDAYTLKPDPNQ